MVASGWFRQWIDRIQDRNGETLFKHDPRFCQGCAVEDFGEERTPILFDQRSQIMDPNTAYELVSMMQGVILRGTAKKTVGGLGFPVAGKTGTTNDSKDAWFVGFTKNLVAGCYIGYDTPRPMGRGAYGGTLCGPVFREFMKAAHAKHRPGRFNRPRSVDGTITIKVHALTGERLPDDAVGPHVLVKTYNLGVAPELLASIDPTKIDDVKIFAGLAEQLPFILPEGDDVPLARTSGGGSSGSGQSAAKPSNVGLGTGGLY